MSEYIKMNKYQFKNKTELGTAYYYCYGDDRFEKCLNIKNIKYKKGTVGKNLFEEKDKEIERLTTELESANESITWWQNRFNAVERDNERLNNIISELENYMIGKDIYKILLYKLRDLKESENNERNN